MTRPNLVIVPGERNTLPATARPFLRHCPAVFKPFRLDREWVQFAESFPDPRPSVPCVACGDGVRHGMVDLHRAHGNPALCFSCYETALEERR